MKMARRGTTGIGAATAVVLVLLGSTVASAALQIEHFTIGDRKPARPYTIVAGPDGNLWFTESDVHRIGRITPAGVITSFKLPTGRPTHTGSPWDLTATCGSRSGSGTGSA